MSISTPRPYTTHSNPIPQPPPLPTHTITRSLIQNRNKQELLRSWHYGMFYRRLSTVLNIRNEATIYDYGYVIQVWLFSNFHFSLTYSGLIWAHDTKPMVHSLVRHLLICRRHIHFWNRAMYSKHLLRNYYWLRDISYVNISFLQIFESGCSIQLLYFVIFI